MANLRQALTQVKDQLDRLVPDSDVEDLCRDNGHAFRRGKLGGPAGAVRLMLLQLLAAVSLAGLRHSAGAAVSPQALGKAFARLPLGLWLALVRRICPPSVCPEGVCPPGEDGPDAGGLWHGLRVMIVDATSVLTEDTPELAGKYGKARNGKRSCDHGRPSVKLLAVLDRAGGFIRQAIPLPWSCQEKTCLSRLLKACGPGTVLLGDRAMAGYGQLARMLQEQVHCCFRLTQWKRVIGRGKANHRLVRRQGRQDQLVRWHKDAHKATWLSRRAWAELPEHLELRQIAFRITRKGYRTQWAWLVTTLLDPVLYPAEDLVELYESRWQVEVYFRDLKQTLGLKQTTARSVKAVQKQLLAFVVLYNLVRQVMSHAAQRQGVAADRISFTDAARWLLWSEPGDALGDLVVNPVRERDTQPRVLKHGRRKYARLDRPRSELIRPRAEAKL